MNKIRKLQAKIDALDNPIVQDIVKDLDPCSDPETMKQYYRAQMKKLLPPCTGHYRQMDLEEAIENEKKDNK